MNRCPPRAALPISTLLLSVAFGPSCKKDEPKPAEPESTTQAAQAQPAPAKQEAKKEPAAPKFQPLEWDDPSEWKRVEPSSKMRRASYEIPAAGGDKQAAELNVFILGGDIEPNIQRWVGEFSNFDVKDLVRVDRAVNDVQQAVVEVPKGDFSGGMGSLEGGKGYGLLGAIAVSPSGAQYFFKMTGPSQTVKAARDAFYKLLDSLRVEGSKPTGAEAAKGDDDSADDAEPDDEKAGAAETPAAKH